MIRRVGRGIRRSLLNARRSVLGLHAARHELLDAGSPLDERRLAFFHRGSLGSGARLWPWPEWLALPDEPWAESLRGLYRLPMSFPGSVSPEMGLLLYSLVRNVRPRRAVEVGVFGSVSTHWIAAALPDGGTLTCFDEFNRLGDPVDVTGAEGLAEDRRAWVADRLEQAGLAERVRLVRGSSAREIVRMRESLRKAGGVDLAFIDGDHTDVGVLEDVSAIEPVLSTGGYLLFHDVFVTQSSHDGPRVLLSILNERLEGAYEQCSLMTSPHNYGIAIVRRIG